MEKRKLEKGDVVQIQPDYKKPFGGRLAIVTEEKSFGCAAYIHAETDLADVKLRGKAYIRLKWEDMEYIGHMHWMEKMDL